MAAIQQICQEKNISPESVLATIEAALAAAYRKDYGQKNQNIKVEYDPESGGSRVFDVKTVVEDELKAKAEAEAEERRAALERGEALPEPLEAPELAEGEEAELRYNPKLHIALTDAKEIKSDAAVGEELRVELAQPSGYGRMAAQTAKQVIIQRIREAERSTIYEDFKDKQGVVMLGTVQRREGPNVLFDLGKATGVLPSEEAIERERYSIGERFKVYIKSVAMGSKGPEIILSRRNPEIVRELFAMEIPEVANGAIEIKGIVREAGFRSKVAVDTDDENIDPIGSCVGQRASRVQTITAELGGERIDVIRWVDSPKQFVANAMSPAKVLSVEIDDDKKTATVQVDSEQLSVAIGRNGQNVRLASKLAGYQISIVEVKNGETRVVNVDEVDPLSGIAPAEAEAVAAEEPIAAAEPAADAQPTAPAASPAEPAPEE